MLRPTQAVEPHPVERKGRCLEVQPAEVLKRRHGLARPLPQVKQLIRSVPHLVESQLQLVRLQLRRNDAVRDAPARLLIVRSEQGIVNGVPDLDDRPADVLAEALLVAYLLREGDARDKDNGVAKDLDLEDLAVLLRQLLQRRPRVAGLDVEDVAQDGHARRLGNRLGHGWRAGTKAMGRERERAGSS